MVRSESASEIASDGTLRAPACGQHRWDSATRSQGPFFVVGCRWWTTGPRHHPHRLRRANGACTRGAVAGWPPGALRASRQLGRGQPGAPPRGRCQRQLWRRSRKARRWACAGGCGAAAAAAAAAAARGGGGSRRRSGSNRRGRNRSPRRRRSSRAAAAAAQTGIVGAVKGGSNGRSANRHGRCPGQHRAVRISQWRGRGRRVVVFAVACVLGITRRAGTPLSSPSASSSSPSTSFFAVFEEREAVSDRWAGWKRIYVGGSVVVFGGVAGKPSRRCRRTSLRPAHAHEARYPSGLGDDDPPPPGGREGLVRVLLAARRLGVDQPVGERRRRNTPSFQAGCPARGRQHAARPERRGGRRLRTRGLSSSSSSSPRRRPRRLREAAPRW